MEKLKLYKKQIVIGLLLLIGAIMGVRIMVNDVEVVEEVPVAYEVVDTTMVGTTEVIDLNPMETIEITKWINERDSIDNAMRYWYGVLDTNGDGDIDN